jgi:hypothetical protein
MRKLLFICDSYAQKYDIVFNANKSKFLVIVPSMWRSLKNNFCNCVFSIGGKLIENVVSYPHLGHIINSKFDDSDDVMHRRNCFIGQANNVLCYFNKLDLFVKIKLFKAYCSSIYGSELWDLESDNVQTFCCAWRSALRRLLGLPFNAHSFLLSALTNTLPVFDEICKRSARFIVSCLFSRSQLVRSVAWHGVVHGRYNSVIGKNSIFCCTRFGWRVDDFVLGLVNLSNENFFDVVNESIEQSQSNVANFLLELIFLREGYSEFDTNGPFLTRNDINSIISFVASN